MKTTINPLLQQVSNNLGTESYIVLSGYIGPSEGDTITRLYSSLEISHYIDIPSDEILAISSGNAPEERVKVFIRGSAPIRLTTVYPARAYEAFNGDDNPGSGGDRADEPVSTGGGHFTQDGRISAIKHFKKLFKKFN